MDLLLASSSPFRQELLARLHRPFSTFSPDIDESRKKSEPPLALAKRLSLEKAQKANEHFEDCLCIGADTLAAFGDEVLGKPGDFKTAMSIYKKLKGKKIEFLTGVSLVNDKNGIKKVACISTSVEFNDYSDEAIKAYLELEKPYRSTAGFKSETSVVGLTRSIESKDPTAIVGLPLIQIASWFNELDLTI